MDDAVTHGIAPPVIKDLVVDRSAFDRIIAAACIGCGACVAACPKLRPSCGAQMRAIRFITEPSLEPDTAQAPQAWNSTMRDSGGAIGVGQRLAVAVACATLVQLGQIPYFWVAASPVTPSPFWSHPAAVGAFQSGVALVFGRWPRAWAAIAFLFPVAGSLTMGVLLGRIPDRVVEAVVLTGATLSWWSGLSCVSALRPRSSVAPSGGFSVPRFCAFGLTTSEAWALIR